MKAYFYILFNTKLNKFYIGSTDNIERRFFEHNKGKSKFTKTGMPWELKYCEPFDLLSDARKREAFIKKQKSRKFIEQLISDCNRVHLDF